MKPNRLYKIVFAALFAAQSFLAAAQTNSADAPVDYSTFTKFIAQRNIFDPNRLPNVPTVYRPRPIITTRFNQVDSFSLVGVIGYGEGQLAGVYAFFDGSNLQYQKSAQVNDSIATFKVSAITADSVTLVSGTNTITLGIGEQLHDSGGGHWVFANGTTVSYNNLGFGNGRNRNGFGNGNGGRRRNNGNFNNGNGNFNNGNNNGNFGRRRNNLVPGDNSQPQDPNMIPDDNAAQDNNGAIPENGNAQDANAQDNTAAPQAEQPPVSSADPATTLKQLQQRRAQELQQIGH
jgi:hypothetical protein